MLEKEHPRRCGPAGDRMAMPKGYGELCTMAYEFVSTGFLACNGCQYRERDGLNCPNLMSTGPIREMPLILIVEGEPVFQQIIRKIPETRGFETAVAKYGVVGLMQRTPRRFDLILSYLPLTDLGGFKLFELLNKKGISTPVVFLTASDSAEDEIKGLSLGAKDYISKPVNRDLLLLRVRKSLDRAAAG